MKYNYYFLLLLSALLYLGSCTPYSEIVKSGYYKMDSLDVADKEVTALIAPFKEELDVEMNKVIGEAAIDMPKEQPESLLGNWVADAILTTVKREYEKPIDFAVPNYGGLRIPNLAKGAITRGNIFELMPFDNMLVVLHLDGETTLQFLNHIAQLGGWPISSQMRMMIDKEGKATDIKIGGEPFDKNKTYHVLLSDYIANGGDKCAFFKEKPRDDLGVLFRDAIMQYVEQQGAENKALTTKIEGRITHAK